MNELLELFRESEESAYLSVGYDEQALANLLENRQALLVKTVLGKSYYIWKIYYKDSEHTLHILGDYFLILGAYASEIGKMIETPGVVLFIPSQPEAIKLPRMPFQMVIPQDFYDSPLTTLWIYTDNPNAYLLPVAYEIAQTTGRVTIITSEDTATSLTDAVVTTLPDYTTKKTVYVGSDFPAGLLYDRITPKIQPYNSILRLFNRPAIRVSRMGFENENDNG